MKCLTLTLTMFFSNVFAFTQEVVQPIMSSNYCVLVLNNGLFFHQTQIGGGVRIENRLSLEMNLNCFVNAFANSGDERLSVYGNSISLGLHFFDAEKTHVLVKTNFGFQVYSNAQGQRIDEKLRFYNEEVSKWNIGSLDGFSPFVNQRYCLLIPIKQFDITIIAGFNAVVLKGAFMNKKTSISLFGQELGFGITYRIPNSIQ